MGIIAGVEMEEWKIREQTAGVKNAGVDRRGRKCFRIFHSCIFHSRIFSAPDIVSVS